MKNQYTFGYLGDTFTKDRMTLNAGFRYDHQVGKNEPSTAAANPALPDILGALDFDGSGVGATWNDLSPRASLSYALDEGRKTVLRASFARYAGQLSSTDPSFDNPNTGYGYLAYLWTDTNNDGLATASELDLASGVQYSGPGDPRNPVSSNTIDPNYKANHDNEWIVGLDRELAANLAVSVAYTHRKASDLSWNPRIGLTTADYTATPFTVERNGQTYTGTQYSPDAAKVAATANGRILENRDGYSRSYDGVEVNVVKRLSNKWMARAGWSYMNWVENYDDVSAVDPEPDEDRHQPQHRRSRRLRRSVGRRRSGRPSLRRFRQGRHLLLAQVAVLGERPLPASRRLRRVDGDLRRPGLSAADRRPARGSGR